MNAIHKTPSTHSPPARPQLKPRLELALKALRPGMRHKGALDIAMCQLRGVGGGQGLGGNSPGANAPYNPQQPATTRNNPQQPCPCVPCCLQVGLPGAAGGQAPHAALALPTMAKLLLVAGAPPAVCLPSGCVSFRVSKP